MDKPIVTTHTVIEFGCWYCQLSCWLRHKFNRCHAFCSYCISEADDYAREESNEA